MTPRFTRTTVATALCLALLALAPATQAQTETLQTKQSTALRDQPSASGGTVTTLAAGTSVTRTNQRSGPWMQVQTAAGQTGWVHMFEVSAGGASGSASNGLTGALRGLSGFLNRGSTAGTTTATSTIGIRGLSKEDIQNAAPNLAAVERLEQMRADEAQARRHASERQLVAHNLALLPAPNPPATAAPAGGSFQKEGK